MKVHSPSHATRAAVLRFVFLPIQDAQRTPRSRRREYPLPHPRQLCAKRDCAPGSSDERTGVFSWESGCTRPTLLQNRVFLNRWHVCRRVPFAVVAQAIHPRRRTQCVQLPEAESNLPFRTEPTLQKIRAVFVIHGDGENRARDWRS